MIRQLKSEDANAANLLKIETHQTECCDDTIANCEYTATVATANATLTSITIKDREGANKVLTFPSVSGVAAIKTALETAIFGEGYHEDGEVLRGVTVSTVSTNTIIRIVGEAEVVEVARTGGNTSFVAACTQIRTCEFKYDYAGGNGTLFVANGTSTALADLTFATASAATVDSALTALVPTISGVDTVVVVKNTTTSRFEITITALSDSAFTLGGAEFVRSDCGYDYI
jgi:hypothetical protein